MFSSYNGLRSGDEAMRRLRAYLVVTCDALGVLIQE